MIELANVSKIYDTGKVKVNALKDVSLAIEEGEFIAIMGPSGSGKSTLLNILGFLDKPESGSYHLLGNDISSLSDDELSLIRNHTAGFVFQQFNLLPRMTAIDNAGLPMVYAGKRNYRTICSGTTEARHALSPGGARPQRAFRRRAAARGHSAGNGEQSHDPLRGRADRKP